MTSSLSPQFHNSCGDTCIVPGRAESSNENYLTSLCSVRKFLKFCLKSTIINLPRVNEYEVCVFELPIIISSYKNYLTKNLWMTSFCRLIFNKQLWKVKSSTTMLSLPCRSCSDFRILDREEWLESGTSYWVTLKRCRHSESFAGRRFSLPVIHEIGVIPPLVML